MRIITPTAHWQLYAAIYHTTGTSEREAGEHAVYPPNGHIVFWFHIGGDGSARYRSVGAGCTKGAASYLLHGTYTPVVNIP